MQPIPDYPARLDIDYPDRQLSRVSTFFRIFAAIPILIVLGSVDGGSHQFTTHAGSQSSTTTLRRGRRHPGRSRS